MGKEDVDYKSMVRFLVRIWLLERGAGKIMMECI